MGAGDFAAGDGPAGADPVYIPPALPDVVRADAIFYDPSTKQYDPTVAVHPIDQIVASRCTGQKNQSGSSPDLGTRILARFKNAPPSKHPSIAFQEMQAVLQDLIDAGDVQLLGVTFTVNPSTKAQIVIPNYVNLRTQARALYPFPGQPTSTSV